MSIRFACPKCRQPMSTEDGRAGTAGRCPKCGQLFTVPGLPVAVIAAPEPVVTAWVDRDREDDREDDRVGVGFRCPFCRSPGRPGSGSRATTGAWILAVLCFFSLCLIPFCWLPLLVMRERWRVCKSCGVKLG